MLLAPIPVRSAPQVDTCDTTQPRPSQTFQTRNDFIPNPGPNEPLIATQANTDALPAQLRTATHPGRRSTQEQAASLGQARNPAAQRSQGAGESCSGESAARGC